MPASGRRGPTTSSFGAAAALGVWALVAIAGAGLAVALAGSDRAQALTAEADASLRAATLAAGFETRSIEVQGAAPSSREEILAAAGVRTGDPLLTLNLADVRGRVEGVGTVEQARVVRLLPDTLVISVSERPRMAIWQRRGVLSVIDPTGRVIREASAVDFPNLPLVVGAGAERDAAAMIELVQRRPRLAAATQALVRVDGRRWDLRLRGGGIVMLPAEQTEAALIRLDALDRRVRLLELGFERVDLRSPETISVRPRNGAAQAAAAAATTTNNSAPTAELAED